MSKNNLMQPAIILFLICLITTGLVSLTFTVTLDARTEQEALAKNANRRLLCPEAADFAEMKLTDEQKASGLSEAYSAKDSGGSVIAWLFSASTRGYGDQVPIMIAVSPDGKITGLKILDNSETPGLGKKVANESFYGQFVGLSVDRDFTVKKASGDQQKLDAISGATISSNAVTQAVNAAAAYFRENVLEVK